MAFVLYCKSCTLPPEYCRYNTKLYPKCLEWMKENQPDLFAEEIKDLSERDPKTAKKTVHLWDPNYEAKEEQKSDNNQMNQSKNKRKRNRKKNRNQNAQNAQNVDSEVSGVKKVQILEEAVNEQQHTAQSQMADIQSKLSALSMNNGNDKNDRDDWNAPATMKPPGKYDKNGSNSSPPSILKNSNPNLEKERDALNSSMNSSQMNSDSEEDSDAEEQRKIAEMGMGGGDLLGRGGNLNKGRSAPSRKELKQRRKQSKQNKRAAKKERGRRQKKKVDVGSDDDDEEEESEEEEEHVPVVRFQGKIPKGAVECELQNRKGKKKVTVIRGFLEKSPEKEARIKSEFRKKFATSVTITFQHPGNDKGPKQVVLMGNKQYDFMKYLHEKFPKAGKLLYYKSKRYGMTPAVDPNMGIVLPPPGRDG